MRRPASLLAWTLLAAAGCAGPGGDRTPPTVQSVTPADGATGVATASEVLVVFSEAMACVTLGSTGLVVASAGEPVEGSTRCDGPRARFSPAAPLRPGTAYTVEVAAAAADLAGNDLGTRFQAGFTTAASGAAPPPRLLGVAPRLAVVGDFLDVAVSGEALATPAPPWDAPPVVALRRTHDLQGAAVEDPEYETPWVRVSGDGRGLSASLGVLVAPGLYRLRVRRADGQEASFADALAVLPRPALTGLAAEAVCLSSGPRTLSVTGSDLPVVEGDPGVVTVAREKLPFELASSWSDLAGFAPGGCARVPFAGADVRLCSRLEVVMPSSARTNVHGLQYRPPPPFRGATTDTLPTFVLETADPPIDYGLLVGAADAPTDLLFGQPVWSPYERGLHVDRQHPPAFTLDGVPTTGAFERCSASTAPGQEFCGWLKVRVPQGTAPGTHTMAWTTSSGCGEQHRFEVAARPELVSVGPLPVCERSGIPYLEVTGTNLQQPSILVDGVAAYTQTFCTDVGPDPGCHTRLYEITGRLPGAYTLTVENGSTPPVRSLGSLRLDIGPGPALLEQGAPVDFFAGIASQVTLPISNVTGALRAAWLVPYGGGQPVPVAAALGPGGLVVTVPASLPAGSWSVQVQDDSPCRAPATGLLNTHPDPVFYRDTFDGPSDWRIAPPWTVGMTWAARSPTGGNPGSAAVHAEPAGAEPWYFQGFWAVGLPDYGVLRFDLRASGAGAPVTAPDVILGGEAFQLEYSLPTRPTSAWTSYAVPLASPVGWTRREQGGGAAPATLADLAQALALQRVWIRGRHGDGAGEAALDNLQLEYRH